MKASGLKAMIRNRWNRDKVYCTADYWDAKAADYDGTAVSGWPNELLNVYYDQKELEILHRCVPRLDGLRVLDIGCGTGRMARYLAGHNAGVLGIDFSEKAIETARQQSPSGNPAYRVQTVFDLQEEEPFDVALSLGCLAVACTDRERLAAALAKVYRALRPGGSLLVIEPIHRGPLHFVLNMNVREFQQVLREAGFDVRSVEGLHFWPVVRVLGHFNLPRWLTAVGYRVGEWLRALTGGTFFGDYKALFAVRPAVAHRRET